MLQLKAREASRVEMKERDAANSPFLTMYVNEHRVFILAKRRKNRGESKQAAVEGN